MKYFASAAAALLIAGCGSIGTSRITQTFNFDFDQIRDGWIPGAADYPAAQAAAVGAFGAVQALPAPLPATRMVPYLRGTNVSGDLFLYQKRFFVGLAALSTYSIQIQLEFATNYQAGCTAGPGPLTVIKAGLSDVEPLTTTDAQGIVRLNIDKGAGTAAGDFTQLGDIRNTLGGCPGTGTFGLRTVSLQSQPMLLTTDGGGGFWLFIGTQSSFTGQHEIYLSGMKLVVQVE